MVGSGIEFVKILKEKLRKTYINKNVVQTTPVHHEKHTFKRRGHCEQSSFVAGFSEGSKTKSPSPWRSPSVFFDFFFSPKTRLKLKVSFFIHCIS